MKGVMTMLQTTRSNSFTNQTLTVADIKTILGIGRRQAYEIANSGHFRVIRIGRTIKIPTESFFIWLNGH